MHGAGGTGEVYLARDTRLGREVAIKVLPADLAGNPERLARVEREARTVAAEPRAAVRVARGAGGTGPCEPSVPGVRVVCLLDPLRLPVSG